MYVADLTNAELAQLTQALREEVRQLKAALVPPTKVGSHLRAWLLLVLEHNYERMRRMSSGGVQPNLNLTLIRSIVVPLAPTAEQTRISAEVDRSLSQEAESEQMASKSLQRISRLRQAILKWAFEGRLVDQDSSDEPASTLIERIRVTTIEKKSAARTPARGTA